MTAAPTEPIQAAWSALSPDRPPGLVTAAELAIEAGVTEAAVYARIKKARRDGLLSPAFLDASDRMLFRREDADRVMKLYGKPGRAPAPGGQQLADAVRAALHTNPKFKPVALDAPAQASPHRTPVVLRGDPPRSHLLPPVTSKPAAPMPEKPPLAEEAAPAPEAWVSMRELMRTTGLGRSAVKEAMGTRQVEAKLVGQLLLYRAEGVVAWLEERKGRGRGLSLAEMARRSGATAPTIKRALIERGLLERTEVLAGERVLPLELAERFLAEWTPREATHNGRVREAMKPPAAAAKSPAKSGVAVAASGDLGAIWEQLSATRATRLLEREALDAGIRELDQAIKGLRFVARVAGVELPAEVPA